MTGAAASGTGVQINSDNHGAARYSYCPTDNASQRVETPMENQGLGVLCTVPDRDTAHAIAERVVEEGLAACVNILAEVTSIYRWQGKVEKQQEVLLVIKTREQRYQALQERIRNLHPYELPEIIAVPIVNGLAGYLAWLGDATGT